MSEFPFINPDSFKKWMKSQNDFDTNMDQNLIGSFVETKFSGKRIIKHITIEDGKETRVVKDFIENGGTIKEISEEEYLIEVKSGSFYINRRYVIV